MRKLLIGAALCSLFAVPGFAGEPAKLTSAQMDQVTAGNPCSAKIFSVSAGNNCIQSNVTTQIAAAVGGGAGSLTNASNYNDTDQLMGDDNDVSQND
jgi:hypothetical protein